MNDYVINLNSVKKNVIQKKATLKAGCRFCAVVKANAYGLGAVRVAHAIESEVDYFAVARIEEFLQLRKSGIKKPILILGSLFGKDLEAAIKMGAEIQINTIDELRSVSRLSEKMNKLSYVHLAFNTGMNRFGFKYQSAELVANEVGKIKNICVKGVFSHIHTPGSIYDVKNQAEEFNVIVKAFPNVIKHLAASEASNNENLQYDMVRIGIDMYIGKHPAVSLVGRVLQVSHLLSGDSCGYNKSFVAKEPTKIATISLGYADALPRCCANSTEVLILGEKCRVIAVCMDCSIVKIPSGLSVKKYDQVVVFGRQHKNYNSLFDFARSCDTISYEVLTNISQRVKRKYVYR